MGGPLYRRNKWKGGYDRRLKEANDGVYASEAVYMLVYGKAGHASHEWIPRPCNYGFM